jgi:ferredoxin
MYRIQIDTALCSGFGICVELAPDVIAVGPDGLAVIRTGLTDNPAVLEAVDSCPMAAITVALEDAA